MILGNDTDVNIRNTKDPQLLQDMEDQKEIYLQHCSMELIEAYCVILYLYFCFAKIRYENRSNM